ncbi:R3H domain-containing protein 1 [Podila horticola]|nr:R3H domain-containing protein 1 [Podila horticola]
MPKIASEEKPVDDKSGAQPKATFTILKAAGPASSPTEEPPTPTIKIATRPKGPPDHPPSTEPSIDEVLVKGMEALDVDEEGNDNESTFDEFLITALKNRNDRIFLLKLELEFTNFINNQSQEQLDFPSLNSYYRMVIHRVANYFKLTRVVDPIHKTIIMYKTDQSAIPALRFSDLMEEEEEQVVKPMKVLKRTPNRPSAGAFAPDGSAESDRRTVSIKEREEAYAKARARIFQEDVPKPKSPEEGSGPNSRSDSPSTKSDTVEEQKSRPKKPNGRKAGSESRTPEEPDLDVHQNGASAASSRDVSRSTSPSLDPKAKGLKPKPKHSKSDLALECTDVRRRKSTTPTSASGSRTHGLARTISSSSSQDGTHSPSLVTTLTESPTVNSPSNPILTKGPDYFGTIPQSNSGSVSPMSSASSRNSGSFSHNNGPKQYRQGGNTNVNGPGSGFGKVNTPFVPKKAHSKGPTAQGSSGGPNTHSSNSSHNHNPNHNQNHNQNHNHNHHQGPHHNMNGSNGNYTHQYPGMAAPWPERHAMHAITRLNPSRIHIPITVRCLLSTIKCTLHFIIPPNVREAAHVATRTHHITKTSITNSITINNNTTSIIHIMQGLIHQCMSLSTKSTPTPPLLATTLHIHKETTHIHNNIHLMEPTSIPSLETTCTTRTCSLALGLAIHKLRLLEMALSTLLATNIPKRGSTIRTGVLDRDLFQTMLLVQITFHTTRPPCLSTRFKRQ